MKQELIRNKVTLSVIKEAFSPHLSHEEFLLSVFPEVLKEMDEMHQLHFIFPVGTYRDSRAVSLFMNGNIKTRGGIASRGYVRSLRYIAFMLNNHNAAEEWVKHLMKRYPEIRKSALLQTAGYDTETYPEAFRKLILSENNPHRIMLYLICWAVFGERISDCAFTAGDGYRLSAGDADLWDDEAFFRRILSEPEKIECIDLAYHSGYKWLYNTNRSDMLADFFAKGGRLRVIVNSPEAAEKITSHSKNPNREYIGFGNSIKAWEKLAVRHKGSVELAVSELPLMHSMCNFRFRDRQHSEMLVIFYTYSNASMKKNHHLHITPASEEYALFEQEFEYLLSMVSDGISTD